MGNIQRAFSELEGSGSVQVDAGTRSRSRSVKYGAVPDVYYCMSVTYLLPPLPRSVSTARKCACESRVVDTAPSHAPGAGPDSAPPPCPPPPLPASRELQIDNIVIVIMTTTIMMAYYYHCCLRILVIVMKTTIVMAPICL